MSIKRQMTRGKDPKIKVKATKEPPYNPAPPDPGFVERINVYHCRQGHQLVTVDRCAGTTPMAIVCPYCAQASVTMWHRVDQSLKPSHEWYKPSVEEYGQLKTEEGRKHVRLGGLMIQKIEEQTMKPIARFL